MKTFIPLSAILCLVVSVGAATSARDISTPASRQATLKTVNSLLAEKAKPAAGADSVKDPFNPSAQDLREDYDPNAPTKDSAPAVRKVDADFLDEIAKQIQPTGSVTLGGEPYLLFGEKRRKMGDKVTVLVDGVEYEVEIGTIEKNRFRIRYNDLQTTRSIR